MIQPRRYVCPRQEVASGISGYEPFDCGGARNDYYYELEDDEDKLQQIEDYAWEVYGLKLTECDKDLILEFLDNDCDCGCGNCKLYRFMEMSKDNTIERYTIPGVTE